MLTLSMRSHYIAPAIVGLTLSSSVHGQVLQWANVLGVSGESYIDQVRTDDRENVYVLGVKANSGSVDLDPGPLSTTLSWDFGMLPGSGYFTAKYDSSGTFLWGYKVDGLRSIAVSPGGNVVLSVILDGSWDADPGPGTHMVSGNGIAIVRWSTNGTFVSAAVIQDAFARHLLTNDSGDVFLIGQFTDSFDVDPGPGVAMLNSTGYSDVWMAKLNALDELEWSGVVGDIGMEYACDLAFSDDNLLLTIRTVGPVPMQQFDADPGPDTAWTTFGQNQGVVAIKLNPGGGYIRHTNFDWPVWWQSPLIRPLPDNGIVLGGAYSGQATFVDADTIQTLSSVGLDAFIQTHHGTIWQSGWTDLFSAYGNELIACMTPFKEGAVIVAGTFTHSLDADPGTGSILYQAPVPPGAAWIGSYCLNDGSHIWSMMVNGSDRDGMFDITWSNTDALVIGGQFSSGADIGLAGPSFPIATTATSSAVVARYRQVNTNCIETAVLVPEHTQPRLTVALHGEVLVVEGLVPAEELLVMDGLGRVLVRRSFTGTRMDLSIGGWAPGVYIVSAVGTQGKRSMRLVRP